MTPERALARIERLLALAGPMSGAPEELRRTAAVAAVKMMSEHGFTPGRPGKAPVGAVDLDDVTRLALRALELEHQLDAERTAHATEIRRRDEQWRGILERVRREERAAARAERKRASRRAVATDRANLAAEGGHARDRVLTREQKSQIGRQGARERWRRWRERHGVESE